MILCVQQHVHGFDTDIRRLLYLADKGTYDRLSDTLPDGRQGGMQGITMMQGVLCGVAAAPCAVLCHAC